MNNEQRLTFSIFYQILVLVTISLWFEDSCRCL